MNQEDREARAVEAAQQWGGQDFSEVTLPDRDEQARLLAELPAVDAETPIMVSRSLRLPVDLEKQIKAAAKAEGTNASEWIRHAIQRALTGASSRQIDLDAAVAALRDLPRSAV